MNEFNIESLISFFLLFFLLFFNLLLHNFVVDLANFLHSLDVLSVCFFLFDPLQILLSKAYWNYQVNFEVPGQFQSLVPTIGINMHSYSPIVELVLNVDLFSFSLFMEKQGHSCIFDDF